MDPLWWLGIAGLSGVYFFIWSLMRMAGEGSRQEDKRMTDIRKLRAIADLPDCHDCGAKPGQPHGEGCDTEMCSVCGWQRLQCDCEGHDPAFARWTGFWPGKLEAEALGMDLNEFAKARLRKLFLVKPLSRTEEETR